MLEKKIDPERLEKVTNQELYDILKNAKDEIDDWTVESEMNNNLSKGAAWNILARDFDIEKQYHPIFKENILVEFEYPNGKDRKALKHIEPDFSKWEEE